MQKTFFAPAERSQPDQLESEINIVSKNDVVSGLLNSVGGLLAIINENRQIIALNDTFLKMLGIRNADDHLGLRLGEILHCPESIKGPAGCGTTMQCRSCGAAIAMVACQKNQEIREEVCALRSSQDGKIKDMTLLVRAHPLFIAERKFTLLFIQDISKQQRRAALERVFLHDIKNMLSVLSISSEILKNQNDSEITLNICAAIRRLHQEIELQRCLVENDTKGFIPQYGTISCHQLTKSLNNYFSSHPSAHGKHLDITYKTKPDISFRSDISLLERILCNLIINAFEAVANDDTVRLEITTDDNDLLFTVWNRGLIPEELQGRIFQRNFSSKKGEGRGLGTFSVKLLGEDVLGGQISFTSSLETGTSFFFRLPALLISPA